MPAVLSAIGSQALLVAEAAGQLRPAGEYRLAPLLLVGASIAAVRARPADPRPVGMTRFGGSAWGVAAVLTAVAILFRSPSGGAAACLITLLAAVDSVLGPTVRRAVLPAWLCLWFAVPLPVAGSETPLGVLQIGAARGASVTLDLAGVRHRAVDGAIETPGRTFPMGGPGDVFFASLAVVALAAALLRRGPLWSTVLIAATVLWSFCAQALLTVASVSAFREVGPEVSTWPAWWPDAAGLVVTLALAWSADRGLMWLMPHGGQLTWQTVLSLLGDAPSADVGSRPAPARRGLIVAAAFAAVAMFWLLPPVGSDAQEGQPEASSDRTG